MSIQHENPTHANDPVAFASYNFVPLAANDVVVRAADTPQELPPHDIYDDKRHTGHFDVTLTTKSPLYVRCALDRGSPGSDEEKARFFHKRLKNLPVIPGSSLRGMLRSVVEIASYGKFNRVTDRRLFYRDIRNRDLYTSRFVEDLPHAASSCFHWKNGSPYTGPTGRVYVPKTRAGFIVNVGGHHKIEDAVVARIDMQSLTLLLGANLYEQREGKRHRPFWVTGGVEIQYRDIWVDLDATPKDYYFPKQLNANGKIRHPDLFLRMRMARDPSLTAVAGKVKGTLVLTGPMQHQHLAFMFFRQAELVLAGFTVNPPPVMIDIPDAAISDDPNGQLWERFHEDQLTQWQEGAFPAHRNGGNVPKLDGHLCVGDPVFYLMEKSSRGSQDLVFFGRASLFRLPYKTRPIDLVPAEMKDDQIVDYADALFGYVRDKRTEPNAQAGERERAFAGRVCVTEARLVENQADIWLSSTPQQPKMIVPEILSSPKPTSYQHYLTQKSNSYQMGYGRVLLHYDSNTVGNEETELRGHKIYWHQGWGNDHNAKTDKNWFETLDKTNDTVAGDTQHTLLNPVKPDVTFKFRIYFENLSARELGALCWAVNPATETKKNYCHKLGMGKPLGMGSVKLKANLFLTDRTARYTSLFAGDKWNTGAKPTITETEAVTAFEMHVLDQIHPERYCDHLSGMKRIGMFLRLMEFKDNSDFARTMPLDDFKPRPILPDPSNYGVLSGIVLEDRNHRTAQVSNANTGRHNNRATEPSPTQAPIREVSDRRATQKNDAEEEGIPLRDGLVKGLWVNIVRRGKAGKYVVTVEGEAQEFVIEISNQLGDRCRCDVTYKKGKVLSGKFKSWA